jgi:hypothetical protein
MVPFQISLTFKNSGINFTIISWSQKANKPAIKPNTKAGMETINTDNQIFLSANNLFCLSEAADREFID